MLNDLATIDQPPAGFSALSLTPNVQAILDRAFDDDAAFTAAEVALVEPIARSVATLAVADDKMIRQSIGSLSAALPSKDAGEAGERLRLNVYMTMLAGCDERALTAACRRCLDELDWMPTVHQLKERMRAWISPEAVAITRARAVLRAPRLHQEAGESGPLDAVDVERVNDFLRRKGLATRIAADGSTYQETDEEAAVSGEGE